MSEFDSEGSNSWTYYTRLNLTTPSVTMDDKGRSTGVVSPMNAASFGFIATAILVSLFLILAIFEHVFGPSPSFASPEPVSDSSVENMVSTEKARRSPTVELANELEVTVTMPGDHHPTYIAQPAPFPPSCPREGIYWPHHHHNRESSMQKKRTKTELQTGGESNLCRTE